MNWTVITAAIAAIGVPLGVWGLIIQARSAAAAASAERDRMRQKTYDEGVTAGRKELQPSVDMIAYQLAEAVRERAEAVQRAAMFEGRYNDLRDMHRKGGG